MPASTPLAQVIEFPYFRVRPGVRQRLYVLRQQILRARDAGSWKPTDSEITPDFLLTLIPDAAELYRMDDMEVAELAVNVSILVLHAIQSGDWNNPELLGTLMKLQHDGMLLDGAARRKTA